MDLSNNMKGCGVSEETPSSNGRRRSIRIKLPMGAEIEIRGYDILMILVAVAAGLGTYFLYTSQEEHQHLQESFAEMVYVLSITQEERMKLNLAMPATLKQKLRSKE